MIEVKKNQRTQIPTFKAGENTVNRNVNFFAHFGGDLGRKGVAAHVALEGDPAAQNSTVLGKVVGHALI